MGQTRPLFVYFLFFSQYKDKYWTNLTLYDKSVDGVLGTRTWGGRMEGVDDSTELWRQPLRSNLRASVTGLGDLFDFGQVYKAFGSNQFAQISHIIRQYM